MKSGHWKWKEWTVNKNYVVEMEVFTMEKVPWKVKHVTVSENTDLKKSQGSQMSMDEIAVHCYREVLNLAGNLENVDFKRGLCVV